MMKFFFSEAATRPGQVGLKNLGNSCFMAAGLQCLSHLEPLVEFCLSGQVLEELNPHHRGLAKAFADLQKDMWFPGNQGVLDPSSLHRKLADLAPHLFEAYDQQDVQEFLAFCLDGLHEDLNRVIVAKPTSEAQQLEDERLGQLHGEEFAAALSWMRHLERGKSFLVDLLQGQQRSSLRCESCGYESRRFEAFLYLSVPVTRQMGSIREALEKHLEPERLTGDEKWHCPRCDRRVDARKKMDMWKLPPVLVIHLKRFEFDVSTYNFRKIKAHLKAPDRLDLRNLCSSEQKDGAMYSVACVANHLGGFGSGHYTATCRVGDKFYYFDDSQRPVPVPEAVGKDAYVLFLTREAPSQAPVSSAASASAASGTSGASMALKRQTFTAPENWPHLASERNSVLRQMMTVEEEDQEVITEGWLKKRGPMVGYKWAKRWCVLHPRKLSYFEDQTLSVKKGDIHLRPGAAALAFQRSGAPGDAIKHKKECPHGFVLDLDPGSGRDRHLFYFDAGSSEDLQRWLQAVPRATMKSMISWIQEI